MKTLLTTLLLGIFSIAYSQDTLSISFAELEEKSLDQNLYLRTADKEIQLAEAELLASRAMYLPNVMASYSFMNTNNPLMAFGFKLNQERIGMDDFNPNHLNDPASISDFATKFEVQQPIFNMDAIYMKKAGNVKTEILQIKKQRTREHIQFEVNKAYMMLQLAYKMLGTLEKAKKTTLANKKLMDDYFENGMVQKSDILYMDVRVNEIDHQIQIAKSNILNASDYLSLLLNEESDKVYKPSEELEYQNEDINTHPILNLNRKDILAYEKSLEAFDWMSKSAKAKYFPRLNAFGSFEFHDHKFGRFRGNGYLVGAQLQWNIFDGLKAKSEQVTYKAQLDKAKTEIEQYNQQSELELKKTYRQVLDAKNKVVLTQKTLAQSKEAYRIRRNRYEQGLEKSSDLLNSETLMAQKELEYHQAIFEFNTSLKYYQFLK